MDLKQFFGTLLKPLLIPFSFLYGLAVWLRNKVYDKGIYSSIEFSVPVISVGNLSMGGTGKTPHIEYLLRLLQYEYRLATMSRGYKRKSYGFQVAGSDADASLLGDEPMQFHQKFPDVIVSVCEDRMTGIPSLIGQYPGIEVILLDDAYQHRSVKPGLNILLMDYHRPFYEDYILPFGSLREGRKRYDRANLIIVTKCPEHLAEKEKQLIRSKIAPLPHQKIYFTTIRYESCRDFYTNEPVIPEENASVIVAGGIARPQPLLQQLRKQYANVHLLRYPDHHYFTLNDLEEIRDTYRNRRANPCYIVTTEKDATRLALHRELLRKWELPVIVIPITIAFLTTREKEQFDAQIRQYIISEQHSTEE